MKILCLGCSWTAGLRNLPYDISYPYLLSKKQNKHRITNAGCSGSSVEFISHVLTNYDIEYDCTIVQITTHDRFMLGLDGILGNGNINDYSFVLRPNNHIQIDHMLEQKSFMNVAPAHGWWANDKLNGDVYDTEKNIEELIERIKKKYNPKIKIDDIKKYLSFWCEYHMNSNVNKNRFYQEIFKIKSLLEYKNKPYYIFKWLSYEPEPNNKLNMNLPSVQDFFGSEFEKLVIDNGFHFGEEGHQRLVDEFILKNVPFFDS